MEEIVDQTVTQEEITKAKEAWEESKKTGGEGGDEIIARFQYSYNLIRSERLEEVKNGVSMLEDLYYEDRSSRRDYLYYLAIGHCRLKSYNMALDCVNQFLSFERDNHQAHQLRNHIEKKLTKDGLLGIAVTGGIAILVGGLIGIGMTMSKKQ